MEALTAVQVGLLTIYDMCKAADRGMVIGDVRVLDVNTVSPPHDSAGMTAFLAATVMWTFLSDLASRRA